jgi:hypothetical protein
VRTMLTTAFLAVLAGTALAQEDMVIDQTKLYVTDPAACEAVEKQGVDAFMELNFLSLTFEGGIQSMEFHCNFYDVKSLLLRDGADRSAHRGNDRSGQSCAQRLRADDARAPALAQAKESDARIAKGRGGAARRHSRSASRICSAPRAFARPPARASSARSSPTMNRP